MGAGAASVLALALASACVAAVFASSAGPSSIPLATLVAVAVPLLLGPLFWPRAACDPRRLAVAALAYLVACAVAAIVLWVQGGAAPSPSRLARAATLALLMVVVLHQLAGLVEIAVRRVGAGEPSAREWAVWTVTALLWTGASAPLWLGPLADLAAVRWPALPSVAAGASPLVQLAAAAGHDLLREQWFYSRTSLGSLQLTLPPLLPLLAGYAVACVALTLAVRARATVLCAAMLLVALGGAADTAHAAPPEVELVPAWGGWSRPGRTTEVEVRLASPRQETTELTIIAGDAIVRSTVSLVPGQPARIAVPLRAAGTVEIDVARAGHRGVTASANVSLSEAPLVAWVAPVPPPAGLPGLNVVQVDPRRMPASADAYAAIDALVIDRRPLASLSQPQLAALLSYLAGCGAAVLVSAAPGGDALLRSAVGCGERRFALAATAADVPAALGRVVATSIDLGPGTQSMAMAFGADRRAWHTVVAVLAVCAAVVAATAIMGSSLLAAAIAPALLAAGTIALFQLRDLEPRLVVWAESESGERVARYQALQYATATRRGHVERRVIADLSRPRSCRPGPREEWRWDAAAARHASVTFDSRLFSPTAICYAGEFPVGRAALAGAPGDDRIEIRNSGGSGWPEGRLAWNGRVFPLAAVPAGGRLEVDAGSGRAAADGAGSMALARTSAGSVSPLWRLDLGSLQDAPRNAEGWLLLRLAPAGGG